LISIKPNIWDNSLPETYFDGFVDTGVKSIYLSGTIFASKIVSDLTLMGFAVEKFSVFSERLPSGGHLNARCQVQVFVPLGL
jgi:hypothetical protein